MTSKTVNILLVEDDKSSADTFEHIVRKIDQISFEIIWVTHVRAAVQKLENHSFHVIMLDLGLPDAEELEALDILLEADSNTPIVILSGNEDTKLATQAMAKGAQDFLVKGEISPQLLVRSIRYAADRQNLKKKVAESAPTPRKSADEMEVQIESSLRMILMHAQNLTENIADDETRRMAAAIERESASVLYILNGNPES